MAKEELILRTSYKPTMLNMDAGLGSALGVAAAATAMVLGAPVTLPVIALAGIIGGVAGGLSGKQRMERDNQYGKVVKEPTKWNKQAVMGGLLGFAAGHVAALGLCAVVATAANPLVVALAGLAAWAMPVIGAIDGASIGSRKGMEAQEQEYQEAQAQRRADLQSGWKHPIASEDDPYFNDLNNRLPKGIKTERKR